MLKAEDIWYSFMRTKLFDRDFRRANGGSKALDEHFIKKHVRQHYFKKMAVLVMNTCLAFLILM